LQYVKLGKGDILRGSMAFTMEFGSKISAQPQAPHYDLVLKGGHVIDPANTFS
jgi:hypothetical protein